jgi:hypothetical protein
MTQEKKTAVNFNNSVTLMPARTAASYFRHRLGVLSERVFDQIKSANNKQYEQFKAETASCLSGQNIGRSLRWFSKRKSHFPDSMRENHAVFPGNRGRKEPGSFAIFRAMPLGQYILWWQ